MTIGFVLVAGCVGLEAGRDLCFKQGASRFTAALEGCDWVTAARPSIMWAGIAFWAAEVLLWVATLQHLPLTVAFPLMAASFAVVPLAGHLFLGERIAPVHLAGMLLVASGVACVGIAGL